MSISTDRVEAVGRYSGVIFGRSMKILNLIGIYIPMNLQTQYGQQKLPFMK